MTTEEIAKQIIDCFKRGNKVMIIGNGGSAAQAQHMAAEFVCRFEAHRKPLPAIALSTDTSALTAIANDYGFGVVFARQVAALGTVGDILILLSTSGKSGNLLIAKDMAESMNIAVIDFPRIGKTTAKIQEKQLVMIHSICRLVEKEFV